MGMSDEHGNEHGTLGLGNGLGRMGIRMRMGIGPGYSFTGEKCLRMLY